MASRRPRPRRTSTDTRRARRRRASHPSSPPGGALTAATCDLCDRPIDGTAYVCRACAGKARAQLREIADAVPAARATAAGQTRHGGAVGGTGGNRLELNLTAQARLDVAGNAVTTWARHVAETRGRSIVLDPADTGPPLSGPTCGVLWPPCRHPSCHAIRGPRPVTDPLEVAARWLAEHVDWLRHRQEAAEAFRSIAAGSRVLVALADGPAERRWLGACEAPTAGGTCPADLYARPGATSVTCRECGHKHAVDDRRHWLDDVARGYSYTAREIGQAYGIPEATIRTWAHRGEITASGEVDGRPIYPLGQVLDLAADKAARRAEREARRAAKRDDGPSEGEAA